jgi:ribose transport system substrate-binding protein
MDIQNNIYMDFFFNSNNLFIILNSNQIIIKYNKFWKIFSGYTDNELLNSSYYDFIHPDDIKHKHNNIEINRFRIKNNTYKYLLFNKHNYNNNIICNIVDITNLKKQNTDKTISYNNMNCYLAKISHELRTPLNSILGFAQLLQLSKNLNIKDKYYLKILLKSGDYLLNIINEILEISKINYNNYKLNINEYKISNILNDSIELLQNQFKHKNIKIIINHNYLQSFILVDLQKMKQIFINILTNAIKYNKINGTININCTILDNNNIKISFIDSGIGISKSNLNKIFIPFCRFNKNIEGNGLGLSLVHKYINLMNGTININSILNKGTTVDLIINYSKIINCSDNNNKLHNNNIIIYIENNQHNFFLIENIINEYDNIFLLNSKSGNIGYNLIKKHNPVIVLLDLTLNDDVNRLDILKKIKEDNKLKNIRVIIISADTNNNTIQESFKYGAEEYIIKPINIHKIINILDNL